MRKTGQKFLSFLLIIGLMGCGAKEETTAGSTENTMRGVAATGAPISNGKVEVKGAGGSKKTTTTSSDGSYSVSGITDLTEPYLVRVIAPTGEKYITVSSKSALAAGKKINITPLTHTIVANVFQEADPDALFDDFTNQASEYSDSTLENEKNALVQKFKDAGLLGSGKIADETVDLLNGTLEAGTSNGVDGLLDVIDVNISNVSNAGIIIALKASGNPIIADKVDGSTDAAPTVVNSTDLQKAKDELTVIDQLRTALKNFATTYSSYASCNEQTVVDDGGSCDIDTIVASFVPHMHPSWSDQGKSGSATVGAFDWVCGEDLAIVDKTSCLAASPAKKYEFSSATFSDVSLISYDPATETAHINFNLYLGGTYRGLNDIRFKKDSGTFKLIGGEQSFQYWIGPKSIHQTIYNTTSTSVTSDTYGVSLDIYYKYKATPFTDGTAITLTSLNGNNIFANGTSTTATIYTVTAPVWDDNGSCSQGIAFSSTNTPWISTDGNETASGWTGATATACSSNPCTCSAHYFDWESNKVKLTATDVANMDKMERIGLSGGGLPAGEAVYVRRPLIVNQYNASEYEPTFGMSVADFCNSDNTSLTLSLATPTDIKLGYISLWIGYQDNGSTWYSGQAQKNFWDDDLSSFSFDPTSNSLDSYMTIQGSSPHTISNKNLWLSGADTHDREFVRRIECTE